MCNLPEMVEVDDARLEEVLHRVEQALDEKDAQLIRAVFQSYAYVTEMVEDKNTSIMRLRQLFFGSRTEKTKDVTAGEAGRPRPLPRILPPKSPSPRRTKRPPTPPTTRTTANLSPRAMGAMAPTLTRAARGSTCGIRRSMPVIPVPPAAMARSTTRAPGVVVRIIGQAPLAANIYQLHKLRCHLCGQVFTAPAPEEAGCQKYDATAGSMIGLLKYGSGLPFNRLEGLQGNLEVPLPASTQWDIVQCGGGEIWPRPSRS